jgi:hypothetical protein
MAKFETYKNAFPHAKLTRAPDGVLEVMLHTNGDTVIFNGYLRVRNSRNSSIRSAKTPKTAWSF